MLKVRLDGFPWLIPLLACGCGAESPNELFNANGVSQTSEQLSVISESDRAEMEQYIADRARDVVHSDVTKSGELVECIPVEAQASLNGQKIASPPSEPGPVFTSDPQFPEEVPSFEGDDICPPGTVPRLGVSLEDVERAGSLSNFLHKYGGQAQPAVPGSAGSASHSYAVGRRFSTNYGAYAVLNLWAPYTDVHDFSLSQIWVWGGSGAGTQTVEAGWQRYPDKYGNNSAHLFSYYTPNNYTNGCYNSDCSAFVQHSGSIFPGQTFSPTSVTGGSQYTISVYYLRDAANGNWWLYVQGNAVGYYPSALFSTAGIKTIASVADFGGEVSSLRTYTSMGGGNFASAGFGYAAYSRNLQYLSGSSVWTAPSLTTYTPTPTCYDMSVSSNASWGTYMYFGGPGVNANCPL
jgi:neprosin-like protein